MRGPQVTQDARGGAKFVDKQGKDIQGHVMPRMLQTNVRRYLVNNEGFGVMTSRMVLKKFVSSGVEGLEWADD